MFLMCIYRQHQIFTYKKKNMLRRKFDTQKTKCVQAYIFSTIFTFYSNFFSVLHQFLLNLVYCFLKLDKRLKEIILYINEHLRANCFIKYIFLLNLRIKKYLINLMLPPIEFYSRQFLQLNIANLNVHRKSKFCCRFKFTLCKNII